MKIQFTHKEYQSNAVEATVDIFAGQPKQEGISYRIDPGTREKKLRTGELYNDHDGTRNHAVELSESQLLDNIHAVQKHQNLPLSDGLVKKSNCDLNLDIEMETGTGKTYVYIKTMFELNRRYGWSKFIIVVPSIAIREGVQKSLEMTAEHFMQDYSKRARFFTYNSSQLHELEAYSSGSGINVMIINVQAFSSAPADTAATSTKLNAKNRIYRKLDDFQSRRPIDVIRKNRPILILDEPQKIEGAATQKSLKEFDPLFMLRYSATHKTNHNRVHRLDALDAYNQKLVKKIGVRGVTMQGLSGTNGYLFLESVQISKHAPVARMDIEKQLKSGIVKRQVRKISQGDNLKELTGLNQYDGYVVSDIDANQDKVKFTNGVEISAGEAIGNVNEASLRRIQIRETIRAHFEKEQTLFDRGIKVLSLFFIDEVAKYRIYDDSEPRLGEYAQIFEEEYNEQLNEILELEDTPYLRYLKKIEVAKTHNGYFSIDKKGKLIDPKVKNSGADKGSSDDISAYDLILKNKERLLSFSEPTRFIFSHSALSEGWDNPNVFVICTLKRTDSDIRRRQEVGRGMRLCVNQLGERMDNPIIAHQINHLTVVTNESYKDFVNGLQAEISKSISQRPKVADAAFFTGKVLNTLSGDIEVTKPMAKKIEFYLIKNDYVDFEGRILNQYHTDKKEEALASLPDDLKPYAEQVFNLVDSVFSEASLIKPEDDRKAKENPLNQNFHKKEFQELWNKINRKAVYAVDFDSNELIKKAVIALNSELRVTPLKFIVSKGEQTDSIDYDALSSGDAFALKENATDYETRATHTTVKYDLVGDLAAATQLTRKTAGTILSQLEKPVFGQYKKNPEEFITKASNLIKEQKATAIIEHLTYNPTETSYDSSIFTSEKAKIDFSNAVKADNHIYDYVFTDSQNERSFVQELDISTEVTVYAKLPSGFSIPTPVGDYNPDWAIAFTEEVGIKHLYFIAETKGSMSSLELREIEKVKINCAKKFFSKISSSEVRYDMVDSYEKLMQIVS